MADQNTPTPDADAVEVPPTPGPGVKGADTREDARATDQTVPGPDTEPVDTDSVHDSHALGRVDEDPYTS